MPSPPDPQPVGYAPKLIGELTEGNLVVGGPSPNTMVDGGSPSAAGGVGAGTIGQLAQYAATGSAVEGATVSGDATIAAGGALTIASGVVTNAKLATMAAHTFKGNNLGVTGAPLDLTLAQFKTELSPVARTVTGTTDTILITDNGNAVLFTNGGSIAVTVPTALGAGFSCLLLQMGDGVFTVTGATATVNNRQSHTKSAGKYAECSLYATAADALIFAGDTAA